MKRWLSVGIVLLLVGAEAQAQKVSDAEAAQGFVSLFNGKDFSGWRFGERSPLPEKLPANWKVKDGLIELSGGGSPHLASQWDYADFDVRFEWRAGRDKYNSGFYVRSGRRVGANQINLAKGAEGGFIGGKLTGAKTVPALQKPAGEWNEWRVLAVGDRLTFWCNGKLAWEGTGMKDRRGYLGLQAEGAPMSFRNLRIREIGFEPLNDLKKWKTIGDWKRDGDGLVSAGKGTLETAKSHGNYVLRLEWQADRGATGAVLLRGGKSEKATLLLGATAGTGAVPGQGIEPKQKVDNPAGQWNYLEVRLADGKLTVWQNGTVVVKEAAAKDLPASGPVGLSAEGSGVRFRNVRVQDVKAE
jgi:hypothetical protein